MITAEFEEKTYEAPLYNQLERANPFIFTPGQVLESVVGFDAGLWTTNMVLWQTLGYPTPPIGTVLGDLVWAPSLGPRNPKETFPNVALNLFLQAKRPRYHKVTPKAIKPQDGVVAPLWTFKLTEHQQKLLETLAAQTSGLAHVSYAAPVFHTNASLFSHMKMGTIVENSTFPSVTALTGHDTWYYWMPGATGAANPEPERIEDAPLLARLRRLSREGRSYEPGDLTWLDITAQNVISSAITASEGPLDAVGAHYLEELRTLDRLADAYGLRPSLRSYAAIALFVTRFDLQWLVVTR